MNATTALPLQGGSSIAEQCKTKIREMLAPYLGGGHHVDFGAALWGALTTEERAFVCRLAKMDRNAAAVDWQDMPDDFRDAIVRAWRGLSAFVGRVEMHVQRRAQRGRA